jgi:hypothetical protein
MPALRPLRGVRLKRARIMLARRYQLMRGSPGFASRTVMRIALNRMFPMSGKWRSWR